MTREHDFGGTPHEHINIRTRLGSDLSASCVLLKRTCYEPNINDMANKIQQQISH
jgi:hypothetical protein